MALTGEAKREWRRKNREKIAAYTRQWVAANPDYVERQRTKAADRKAARHDDRMRTDPDYAAEFRHQERMRTDPEYAASHFELKAERDEERRRIVAERPRPTIYTGGWTCKRIGRIVQHMRAHLNQQMRQTAWDKRVQGIARGLRFMKSLTCSLVRLRKRKKTGWMETAGLLANRINREASKARDKSTRTAWMYRAHRIAKNIRVRARSQKSR